MPLNPFITGLVKVLLVKVCVAAKPTTVSSLTAVESSASVLVKVLSVRSMLLFVRVCVAVFVVAVSPFTVSAVVIATVLGKPIVNTPELSPTVTSPAVPWKPTVPPRLATVELPPTLSKVIPLFVKLLLGIFENVFP